MQGDLTHKECTGTWNKGGFLLKETQSVSESSFIICEWLRVGRLPQTVLFSSFHLLMRVCGIIPCSNIKKKRLEKLLIKAMHCSGHLWSQRSVPRRCVLSIWRLSGVDCRPTRVRALGCCPDTRASGEMWQAKQLNSCYKSHLRGLQCAHLRPCWATSLWKCQSFFRQAVTAIQNKHSAKSAFVHREPRRHGQTRHW